MRNLTISITPKKINFDKYINKIKNLNENKHIINKSIKTYEKYINKLKYKNKLINYKLKRIHNKIIK